jgi:tRNA-uridine 2-sulfurtransferase
VTSLGSVLVAMSGGVDSSVAACLLAEAGYDVLGSHMSLVHLDDVDHGCCGPRARTDAAEVARIGGFGFEIVDLSDEFDRTVIADFVAEHAEGRTPNPCVRCNERIKFGAFLKRADALGVDFVATGHYVRTELDGDGRWHLYRGVDRAKDQSYVLHMLGQRQLARSLFPLGGRRKDEIREEAERLGLPVARKPDSQELCFAPAGDAAGFLERHAADLLREGDMVDSISGAVVGRHRGTARFTVGQRRGLGVSLPEPRYVLGLDASANRVIVGPGDLLERRGLIAVGLSWVAGEPPSAAPFEAEVRIRSRGDDIPAAIDVRRERARIEFHVPQRGVAPGQSVAVYRGHELLGGGRILEAMR